ncbi:LuxR C-terminal-related transcriptional regulator [Pseudomonas sp. BN515]|uniref:LuxR C-terminal-related transcriptional regulator n=1 Tax=Pseudomonas sp. BN515 TaxID=2567892 RepID=UPI0024562FFC|nr:LuxR C-terminal-related transcriptional regulator [Pseudomonas sp. BN515]
MRSSHQHSIPQHQQSPLQISLLASKLSPSPASTGLTPLPRLLKRLTEAAAIPLTLVQAPAGYGKTGLLRQYHAQLAQNGARTAWLSLDEGDNDLAIFSAYLKAALELVDQPIPPSSVLTRVGETSLTRALTSLLELLQDDQRPLYLFIDDVHYLAGSDAVRCLSMLIERAPAHLHFVLTFRGEPCLSVARQRMHGLVADLNIRDLRLNHEETVALLQHHGVGTLPDDQVCQLEERLEGWTGGLTLVALLLRRDPDQIYNLANFSGERRQFADFFLQDVLSRQPAEIRDFLLHTSVLDRLEASLCNTLTRRQDGQDMLHQCESLGLFLTAIDEEQRWYRFHPLFAEFLRRELQKKDEGLSLRLHMAASDWLVQAGDYVEAYNQAIAARDYLRAAEIMDTYGEDIFSSHENAWALAEKLPEDIIIRFPAIILSQIWQLEMRWEFETCKALLEKARGRLEQIEHDHLLPLDRITKLRNELLHRELMLNLLSDQVRPLQAQTQFLIDNYADAHPLVRGSLFTTQIYARRESYQLDEVERLNTICIEYFKRLPNDLAQVFHSAIVGPSRLMAGRTQAAIQSLGTALRSATQLAGHRSPLAAMIAVNLAKVHYERDEIPQARKLLDAHLQQACYLGFVDQAIAGWLTHARISMLDGDKATAFRMLDEADVFATEHDFERLRLFSLAERLKWLLRQGETDEVVRLGRKNQLRGPASDVAPHANITTLDEARALVWVRVAQAEDRLAEALGLAKLWHRHLEGANAVRSMLRWGIIIAHLSVLTGDQRAAQRVLRRALFQAAPCGFKRVFLDEGEWLARLLSDQLQAAVIDGEPADAFASSLLESMEGSRTIAAAPAPTQGEAIYGALNSRELDILEMVAMGLLNREIGIKLGMTEGSVKWYLQQIYDKIGVRRRSQAADRARQLGILR